MFLSNSNDQIFENFKEKTVNTFPPFDISLFPSHIFWLTIFFIIFYFFMSRIILPRIGSIIEIRRDRIASDIDQAKRIKQEANISENNYQKELKDAREKAHFIAQNSHKEVKKIIEGENIKTKKFFDEKFSESLDRMNMIYSETNKYIENISKEIITDISNSLVGNNKISEEYLLKIVDSLSQKQT